jgi:hypothetical protein
MEGEIKMSGWDEDHERRFVEAVEAIPAAIDCGTDLLARALAGESLRSPIGDGLFRVAEAIETLAAAIRRLK